MLAAIKMYRQRQTPEDNNNKQLVGEEIRYRVKEIERSLGMILRLPEGAGRVIRCYCYCNYDMIKISNKSKNNMTRLLE